MTPLERARAVLAAARRCSSPACMSCPSTPTAEQIAKVIEDALAEKRELLAQMAEATGRDVGPMFGPAYVDGHQTAGLWIANKIRDGEPT